MKTISKPGRLLLSAAALLVAGALLLGTLRAQGFWDESRAVHIKADGIENSTLAIGTHLIHLSALTDAVYSIAEQSAEESGQNQIYYKSELGGGAWFNITSASSLEDITTGGMPATDEEIEELFFTHHTKSDQITYDLRTGEAVNIFDIRDPYDLENLDEMSPLKMYYDQLVEMEGDEEIIARLDEFWATPVSGEEAPEGVTIQEENLSALQAYLNDLKKRDADARETEKVSGVMEAVDAARRYYVFAVVKPKLEFYLNDRGAAEAVMAEIPVLDENGAPTGEVTQVEVAAGSESLPADPELLSAMSEALGNTEEALITYGGKMLSEGVTVMSAAEFEFSVNLINNAKANNYSACDQNVQELLLLDNIQNGVISKRPEELALLNSKLLPDAESAYQTTLRAGESAEYRAAAAKNEPQAILNSLIKNHESTVETQRGELEFLIDAKQIRMATQEAMAYVEDTLAESGSLLTELIPDDDFAESSGGSVDEHIQFLADLRRKLELALGGNELDKLIAEKEDLQTQRMEALDNNDLESAKNLQSQIEAKEESIRAMEAENAARIADLKDQISTLEEGSPERAALESDLAALESSLSDGTLGATVAEMKKNGDVEGLAALLPSAPKLVLPALQDLYNDLLLNGGDKDQIDLIEQAILDNPNALRDELSAAQIRDLASQWLAEKNRDDGALGTGAGTGAGAGTGTGTGTGTGSGAGAGSRPLTGAGGISRDNALNTLAAVIGLNQFYEETGDEAAAQVMNALAQEQMSLGNLLFFNRIEDSAGEYVPLSAIQTLTGRRYVWEKNSSMGVLAFGADYYGFTLYSDGVKRDRDGLNTEEMNLPAKYQNGVHIPAEYAYEEFDVQTVYLAGTSFGCISDDSTMALAQELFQQLLAAQ